jgi:signal transduction histidine kinase
MGLPQRETGLGQVRSQGLCAKAYLTMKTRTSEPLVTVGVVGENLTPLRGPVVAAIEAAGGCAESWTEASVVSKSFAADAIVFALGAEPARFLRIAAALDADPPTRWLPRIVIAAETVTAAQLAPFGRSQVVLSSAPPEVLAATIAEAVEQARARNAIARLTRNAGADLRALERALEIMRQDGVTLSHDARVLFGVILGFASNLRDGVAGPMTEEQRRQLVNIVDATNDAATLLDRYVTSLRRKTTDPPRSMVSRMAPRRHNDLGELVRATVALFGSAAAEKQIRLHTTGSRPASAWCDALQMKQALVNLITNALKFTPPGGAVEVIARTGSSTTRGHAPPRREVELVVIDTGPGIPEDDRERVLGRGVRLDRDRATPGTGVGLAIVREIAELHGGLVRIDEPPTGGASVAIIFPADRRERGSELPSAINGSAAPHAYGTSSPPHAYASSAPPHGYTPSAPPSSTTRKDLRREPE